MDYQQILVILMNVIFISYTMFIGFKYGVQKSISESYYVLPKKWNIVFTLALWGFALPAAILANGDGLMFFAAAGIMFVGAAAQMHQDFIRKVHMIAAIGGIALGELSIIFMHDMWWLTAIAAAIVIPIVIFDKKTKLWWAEVVAFISISLAFILQYF